MCCATRPAQGPLTGMALGAWLIIAENPPGTPRREWKRRPKRLNSGPEHVCRDRDDGPQGLDEAHSPGIVHTVGAGPSTDRRRARGDPAQCHAHAHAKRPAEGRVGECQCICGSGPCANGVPPRHHGCCHSGAAGCMGVPTVDRSACADWLVDGRAGAMSSKGTLIWALTREHMHNCPNSTTLIIQLSLPAPPSNHSPVHLPFPSSSPCPSSCSLSRNPLQRPSCPHENHPTATRSTLCSARQLTRLRRKRHSA